MGYKGFKKTTIVLLVSTIVLTIIVICLLKNQAVVQDIDVQPFTK